jgi:hypothetical protein
MPSVTHTTVYTVTVPANPYLTCIACGNRVEGFYDKPGPVELYPCGHVSDYADNCPSWGPVDGCTCDDALGYHAHARPPLPPTTDEGKLQGPIGTGHHV